VKGEGEEEMLGCLAVDADVEAGDAEVVNCSGEGRVDLERSTVGIDGFFGTTAIGESSSSERR
jgi:hypothetical protein